MRASAGGAFFPGRRALRVEPHIHVGDDVSNASHAEDVTVRDQEPEGLLDLEDDLDGSEGVDAQVLLEAGFGPDHPGINPELLRKKLAHPVFDFVAGHGGQRALEKTRATLQLPNPNELDITWFSGARRLLCGT